jgi:hypothetical protein
VPNSKPMITPLGYKTTQRVSTAKWKVELTWCSDRLTDAIVIAAIKSPWRCFPAIELVLGFPDFQGAQELSKRKR